MSRKGLNLRRQSLSSSMDMEARVTDSHIGRDLASNLIANRGLYSQCSRRMFQAQHLDRNSLPLSLNKRRNQVKIL